MKWLYSLWMNLTDRHKSYRILGALPYADPISSWHSRKAFAKRWGYSISIVTFLLRVERLHKQSLVEICYNESNVFSSGRGVFYRQTELGRRTFNEWAKAHDLKDSSRD